DPDSPRDAWIAAVPDTHLAFLRGLSLMHREGGYAFVHAGIRPGVALDKQARDDLLRMRQPFLYSDLDSGAVFGGKLTCIVLERDTLGFLTADPVGEPVSIAHR